PFVRGLTAALRGQKTLPMPADWPSIYQRIKQIQNRELQNSAMALTLTFGDATAMEAFRTILMDQKENLATREIALESLLTHKDPSLAPFLRILLAEPALRRPALRGLAAYNGDDTPDWIFDKYATYSADEKRDAVNTLASRTSYALRMLDAVAKKKVPSTDIPAEVVRQLRNLNNKDIDKTIGEVWGLVQTTPADRIKAMAAMKRSLLTPGPAPDLTLGRAMFAKICQQCHTLFAVGGKVGPDITGANRASIDYLLENILDPSAIIPKEYIATKIDLKNGRVVTGIVKEETKTALTVVTQNETLTIPVADIDDRTPSSVSM